MKWNNRVLPSPNEANFAFPFHFCMSKKFSSPVSSFQEFLIDCRSNRPFYFFVINDLKLNCPTLPPQIKYQFLLPIVICQDEYFSMSFWGFKSVYDISHGLPVIRSLFQLKYVMLVYGQKFGLFNEVLIILLIWTGFEWGLFVIWIGFVLACQEVAYSLAALFSRCTRSAFWYIRCN